MVARMTFCQRNIKKTFPRPVRLWVRLIIIIIWANIKHVVYACTKEDAAEIGFRDDMIYSYLNGEINDLLDMQQTDQKECKELFEEYKKNNKIIY